VFSLAKAETVLQGMFDKLIEIGRRYGMEMNMGKTEAVRCIINTCTHFVLIIACKPTMTDMATK
jgi:hypothetical protein